MSRTGTNRLSSYLSCTRRCYNGYSTCTQFRHSLACRSELISLHYGYSILVFPTLIPTSNPRVGHPVPTSSPCQPIRYPPRHHVSPSGTHLVTMSAHPVPTSSPCQPIRYPPHHHVNPSCTHLVTMSAHPVPTSSPVPHSVPHPAIDP